MGSQERSWLFFVICGDLAAKMKIFVEFYKFICIIQIFLLPLQPIWVQRRSARTYTCTQIEESNLRRTP